MSIRHFVELRLRSRADPEVIAREVQQRFPLRAGNRSYVMRIKRRLEAERAGDGTQGGRGPRVA